jgi:hypothetical protein
MPALRPRTPRIPVMQKNIRMCKNCGNWEKKEKNRVAVLWKDIGREARLIHTHLDLAALLVPRRRIAIFQPMRRILHAKSISSRHATHTGLQSLS